MKRFGWLILGFALSSVAHASFEMALIGDSTNKCIHRIDPITGAYLGYFGKGQIVTPTAFAINQAAGECLVYDNTAGSLSRFNYNTGELKNSVLIGSAGSTCWMTYNAALGRYAMLARSTGVFYYDSNGTFQSSQSAFNEAGLAYLGNTLYTYNFGTSKLATLNGSSVTDVGSALTLTNPGAMGNLGGGFGALIDNTATPQLRLFADGAGIYGNIRPLTQLASAAGFGRGHGSLLYVAGRTATGAFALDRLQADNTLFATEIDTLTYSQIGTPTGMAMVVAPEPGVFAGFGTGVLALALLRRKK